MLIRNISSVYHIVAMRVIKHIGHTYGGFDSVFFLEPGYDRRMVGCHAGRGRLRRSYHANFIALWCNNRGGEAAGIRRHGKMAQ
jgi:hypothetical protein